MSNWILVLFLFGSAIEGGNAMTAINGFISKKECMAAGEAWRETKRELERDYICFLGVEK